MSWEAASSCIQIQVAACRHAQISRSRKSTSVSRNGRISLPRRNVKDSRLRCWSTGVNSKLGRRLFIENKLPGTPPFAFQEKL